MGTPTLSWSLYSYTLFTKIETYAAGLFNFAVLIISALNILRMNKVENFRGELFFNAMNFEKMMKMIYNL